MSNYFNISNSDMELLLKLLKNQKNFNYDNIYASLNYQYTKNILQNAKFRLAAKNLLSKIDSKMIASDEFIIDDDALVSESSNGAYVHCWVWVENDIKNKKTRKNTK